MICLVIIIVIIPHVYIVFEPHTMVFLRASVFHDSQGDLVTS